MRAGRRWGIERWILVALVMLAWGLRLSPTLRDRLHPDEALYGYWGLLIGRGQDPWLVAVPVYKPPLMPYLIAGAPALFGNSELAVRLPGLAAGLLTIPLGAGLARNVYRDRWVALIAGVAVALSPFALLFSATAFTDPLMVTLGVAACAAAAGDRPVWAGILAGLSFAAKQPGLVWLPLAILIQLATTRVPVSRVLRLVLPSLLVYGLVFAWDFTRVTLGGDSFWRTGISGYGGLRLIWPQEVWRRLRDWAAVGQFLFVSPVVNAVLCLGVPLLTWRSIKRSPPTRESFADVSLVCFLLVYCLFHWLGAFPVWDRYLLPLVPVVAVLLGRSLVSATECLSSSRRHWLIPACSLLLIALLLVPAWSGARSGYPVGGDHGAYDGIDQVVAFLDGLPGGSVVYHHWLGWHYAYYLFDSYVYLAYWPTPAWLARDVLAFGDREARYVVFPSWESPARVEWALAGVGYRVEPVLNTTRRDGTTSFVVYQILAGDD